MLILNLLIRVLVLLLPMGLTMLVIIRLLLLFLSPVMLSRPLAAVLVCLAAATPLKLSGGRRASRLLPAVGARLALANSLAATCLLKPGPEVAVSHAQSHHPCSQASAGTPSPMLVVSPGDDSSVVAGAPSTGVGLPPLECRNVLGGIRSTIDCIDDGRNATNNVHSSSVFRSNVPSFTILPNKPQ